MIRKGDSSSAPRKGRRESSGSLGPAPYITPDQAAAILGTDVEYLDELIALGKLRPTCAGRTRRFSLPDVIDAMHWMERTFPGYRERMREVMA